MLNRTEVGKYLAHFVQIKKEYALVDIHVHPFEVIFNDLKYVKNARREGLYSSADTDYTPPQVTDTFPGAISPARCQTLISDQIRQKCLMLSLRKTYLHTGPQVFNDQMLLSGIDRVLLLPVSGAGLTDDTQLGLMADMFGPDPRFSFGYCVPNCLKIDQIEAAVSAAVNQHGVKAIKIHPAITGIDLQSSSGLERVEAILQACRGHDLSIIIHGGKSPDARTAETVDYGELDKLGRVNWSLTNNPVVIAHGGTYGYEDDDLAPVYKSLLAIMEKHDNVMIDLSGLKYTTLLHLLNAVDAERVVFGSDALYFPQWRILVALYHALCQTFPRPDDHFIKITSSNPLKIVKEVNEPCSDRSKCGSMC